MPCFPSPPAPVLMAGAERAYLEKEKKNLRHTHIQCFNPEACGVMVGLITVEFDPRRTRADYPRCCRGRH